MNNLTFDELMSALKTGVVCIRFTKINGEEREMNCTLNFNSIPEEHHPKHEHNDVEKSESLIVSVFNVDQQVWRSFRKDNLIEWSMVNK